MPSAYTVSAGLFAGVGSRFEKPAEMGMSHFIEHMLFKGGSKYSAKGISESIEGAGGSINGYTTEESTCFYVKALPESFRDCMDVLLDMYTAPLFNLDDLEKEREVIIEEIHSCEDQPSSFINDLFSSVVFPGHPLGNWILGTEDSVSKITAEQLRAFYERYYIAPNTVIAVAGAIKHSQVVDWAKQHSQRFRSGVREECVRFKPEQSTLRVQVEIKETEQCHLQFGVFCSDRYDSRRWSLRVLNTIVGENMSSRLFQEIREKHGFAYHITSALDLYDDVGCFYVQSSLERNKVDVCIEASMKVLKELCNQKVTPKELARAKRYIIGQTLQDMENSMASMLWAGEKLLTRDRNFSTEDFCKKIEAVTAEQVHQCAKEIFISSAMNIAITGPYQATERLPKILTFEN